MIRRKTTKHKHPAHIPINKVKAFPRAQFGLPVIFEFKPADRNEGDPYKTHLVGAGDIDRMASPLIFRPLSCRKGSAAVVLVLDWDSPDGAEQPYTPPGGLRLTKKDRDGNIVKQWPVTSGLNSSDVAHIDPLKRQGTSNPLLAFLKSVH
jgi:CRISPR-associated protein Cmr1